MERRVFLKSSVLGMTAAGLGLDLLGTSKKTHILTLSFDDGFKKSLYKIADIYENYDLSACFNVIASGHLPDFQKVDDWILPELLGNFNDWNALKSRGHEVMPHSWRHLNLARQPIEEAKKLIDKCLDYFTAHLEGYDNSKAVFNFPFNSSTPELEAYTLSKVQAIRSRALDDKASDNIFRKGCKTMGPKNIDGWVKKEVNKFLKSPGGWLILNVHGVDGEGWGPMSSTYLDKLLSKLTKVDSLEVLPTAFVLNRIKDD